MKGVHNLIASTAKSIAHEAYESMAHDNAFYAEWPNREAFVQKNWPMFVGSVRAQFLEMLKGDYPEAMKQPIYEAMCIDGSMRPPINAPAVRTKTRAYH